MLTISIILIVVSILLILYSVYALKHTHQINQYIDKKNKELIKECQELEHQKNNTLALLESRKQDVNSLDSIIEREKNQLTDIQNNISKTLDNQKELSQKAFENYCEVLEKQYDEYEKEYNMYKDTLETSYSNRQLELIKEITETQEELNQIKATRAAAIQAQTREKEIEEQLSFYCLQVSNNDLKDISVLDSIKEKLNNPRILSMLIWQTYFQKPMNVLCANVIGSTVETGIYKITNQKTKECYIGQAIDLAARWKQHAKCGLGIDTPVGNKLYKAMQDYGIWNFSWEVLEKCSSTLLDEKEKYYIDLYDSYNFGLNGNRGNNK